MSWYLHRQVVSNPLQQIKTLAPYAYYDVRFSRITSSGGRISQIDDLSGNGNHVAQGISVDQPFYGNYTINGIPVITSESDSLFLSLSGYLADGLEDSDFTILICAAADNSASSQTIIQWTVNTGPGGFIFHRSGADDIGFNNIPLTSGGRSFGTNGTTTGLACVMSGISWDVSTQEQKLYLNDESETATGAPVIATSGGVDIVFPSQGPLTLVGIANVGLFRRALSEAEVAQFRVASSAFVNQAMVAA